MKQIYAVCVGENIEPFHTFRGVAVSEDGETLTNHTSSSIGFLKNDLGVQEYLDGKTMYAHKRKIFDDKLGKDNWKIQWVDRLPIEVEAKMK